MFLAAYVKMNNACKKNVKQSVYYAVSYKQSMECALYVHKYDTHLYTYRTYQYVIMYIMYKYNNVLIMSKLFTVDVSKYLWRIVLQEYNVTQHRTGMYFKLMTYSKWLYINICVYNYPIFLFAAILYSFFIYCYIFLNLDSSYTLAKLVGIMFRIIHIDNISRYAQINKSWNLLEIYCW